MVNEQVYRFPLPAPTIPETSTWHFIYHNPKAPKDDKVIYIDGLTDRTVKFGELRSLSKRLAHGFLNGAKLKNDDVILVFSPNTLLYPAVVHASQAASLCITLANPTYAVPELVHHIKDSRAKILVVGQSVLAKAIAAAAECGIPGQNIYMIEEEPHGKYQSVWTLAGKEEFEPRRLSPKEAKDRTALMCYSSGTTGRAKGVETTHYNLAAVATQLYTADPEAYTESERYLAMLPMYHIYGCLWFIFMPPFYNIMTVILPKFEPLSFLQSIQKYRITNGLIVPPMALFLAKDPLVDKYDLSSIKKWGCGAAPLGNDLNDAVEKRTKRSIRGGYGMTETTCVISFAARSSDKFGSVGKLLPGMTAKLIDGELWVKGPNIMKGYLRNDRANRETFTEDGWMKTGDVCIFDEDGDIYVVDRVKELIKYKGSQVPPAELEDLLLRHPDVKDAAVVGVYDNFQATEVPRAYVTLSETAKNRPGIEKQIVSWVEKYVSNAKRLRGGVIVIDVIPKSPSGKILRRFLRDQTQSKGAKL